MTIHQISVFLENRAGQLAEITSILAAEGIDLRAIHIAETADYGVLRMIVDKPQRTARLLLEHGLHPVHDPGGGGGGAGRAGRPGEDSEPVGQREHRRGVCLFRVRPGSGPGLHDFPCGRPGPSGRSAEDNGMPPALHGELGMRQDEQK